MATVDCSAACPAGADRNRFEPCSATVALPRVSGRCPMGCGETLFLGVGGHITCSYGMCPDLFACELHSEIAGLDGPPEEPGHLYRVCAFDQPWERLA